MEWFSQPAHVSSICEEFGTDPLRVLEIMQHAGAWRLTNDIMLFRSYRKAYNESQRLRKMKMGDERKKATMEFYRSPDGKKLQDVEFAIVEEKRAEAMRRG